MQQTARKHFAPQFHAEQPLSISQLADVVGLCCQPPQVVSHAQLGPVEGVGLHSIFSLEGSETPLHSDKYQYCSIYQVHDSEQLKLLQLTCVGQDSRPVDLVPLAGLLVLSAEDFHVQTQNVARFSPNEAHRWDDFGIRGSCFGLRYSESSDIIRHSNRSTSSSSTCKMLMLMVGLGVTNQVIGRWSCCSPQINLVQSSVSC